MYIEQPQGFEVNGMDSHLCSLNNSLYGLEWASKAWYSRIDAYLHIMASPKVKQILNLYYIFVHIEIFTLVLYVDDFIHLVAEFGR